MKSAIVLMTVGACVGSVWAETPADPLRTAIARALRRVEQGAESYTTHRDCFSCHHQAMALQALASARRHGFEGSPAVVRHQVDFTLAYFKPKHERIAEGKWMPGGNTMAAYALVALQAAGQPADDTAAALVRYLLVRQRPDGSWPALTQRPPTEGSTFTNTALAIRGLKAFDYSRAGGAAKDLPDRIAHALAQGKSWLLANAPDSTEDKVFRLQGLVASGAAPEAITAAQQLLLQEQRPDGSWAQLHDLAGDAYATGSVLMALHAAGLKSSSPAFQKALRFLLAAQTPEGAWIVSTRSKPIQIFFDNGDPGGKSQFISQAATAWALLALLESTPER
jgi:N-acyl-D-amino-acid deacylase